MPHLIGQLLVSLWPAVFTLAFLPLAAVFFVLDFLAQESFVSAALFSLWWTLFACLGITFFGTALLRLSPVGRRFLSTLSRKGKAALVGLAMIVLYGVTSLLQSSELPSSFGYLALLVAVMVFGGMASLLWFLFKAVSTLGKTWLTLPKRTRKAGTLVLTFIGAATFLYPFLVVVVVLIWFLWDPLGTIADVRMHTLHAAIKNTCILDEKKENCPHTLEDIRRIEPKVYDELQQCCQMQYTYTPENNQYVFVVRYSPVQAAMFSQRFVTETEWGTDYRETKVAVWGKDRITDSLLPGTWEFPEWKYRFTQPNLLH